jgi:hypothetical protein
VSYAHPPYGNYESPDGITNWTVATGASISHETSDVMFGAGAIRCDTPGAATLEGCRASTSANDVAVSAATEYTISFSMKAPAGATMQLRITQRTADGVTSLGNVSFSLTQVSSDWERHTATFTTVASTGLIRDNGVWTRSTAQAITFRLDGWQYDLGPTASTYDGPDAGEPEPPIENAPETLIVVRSSLRLG